MNRAGERRTQAIRATDLNRALSALHTAHAAYSQADFLEAILPIYQHLIGELQPVLDQSGAEQAVIEVMDKTTRACRRAARVLLPAGRPGTDYRSVEIDYTDALVTVMAVDCVLKTQPEDKDPPEIIAARLIPASLLNRLQSHPMVWEDWQGFFVQSPTGGLYAVSCEPNAIPSDSEARRAPVRAHNKAAESPRQNKTPKTPQQRSAATGWRVVDGIKACLADGTLSCNQPGDLVQVDAQGRVFLQTPAIFEAVKTMLGWEEGARNLENRFVRLNINRQAPGGWKRFRGKSLRSEPMVQGYVIEDSTLLWDTEIPPGRFVVQNVTTPR